MSVSYTVENAAAATGIGTKAIRAAIRDGDLVAHYVGVKAIIRAADLDEWVATLPTDRRAS